MAFVTTTQLATNRLPFEQWARPLRWLDKRPLLSVIEPYRLRNLTAFLDDTRYSVGLFGRAKKNWKSADAMVSALRAVCEDSASGSQIYVLANDKDQARDDLVLLEKLVRANPLLAERLRIKKNLIERKDGRGFVEVLPAQDVAGTHGKTFRLVVFDEIHAYRTWDLFEALAFDPTRPESQWLITSYASLFHKPGVPLFDLMAVGKAGSDPRLLFNWYGGDFTTDPEFADAEPEARANPSRASWGNDTYLAQQRRLLPSHKFRRLHLNLPGAPEGSAFQPEPVMDAIERGVAVRAPQDGIAYAAFVDMSGGSSDDAVLGIAHRDADGRAVLDAVVDQGQRAPFDPNKAVEKFVRVLSEYRIGDVTGDKYAGLTFRSQFETQGIAYHVAARTASELYEALEPVLNSHGAVLLDVPVLEQQLLGLVWRGGKISHPAGEHDDYANAVAGVVRLLARQAQSVPLELVGGHSAETLSVEDAQRLSDEEDAERRKASAEAIEAAVRNGGVWMPSNPFAWMGRR